MTDTAKPAYDTNAIISHTDENGCPVLDLLAFSPEVAAGSHTWQACPILVGTMSTSTANRPPDRMAAMMALTIVSRSP